MHHPARHCLYQWEDESQWLLCWLLSSDNNLVTIMGVRCPKEKKTNTGPGTLVNYFRSRMKSDTEIRTWYQEQINTRSSFLPSCLGDLQKTGELLDSPLLSEIDEVIKNLPQEKVLGPGRATGDFYKTFVLALSVRLLDEFNHLRDSGGFFPASPYIQIILIAKKDKDTKNCSTSRFNSLIKMDINSWEGSWQFS